MHSMSGKYGTSDRFSIATTLVSSMPGTSSSKPHEASDVHRRVSSDKGKGRAATSNSEFSDLSSDVVEHKLSKHLTPRPLLISRLSNQQKKSIPWPPHHRPSLTRASERKPPRTDSQEKDNLRQDPLRKRINHESASALLPGLFDPGKPPNDLIPARPGEAAVLKILSECKAQGHWNATTRTDLTVHLELDVVEDHDEHFEEFSRLCMLGSFTACKQYVRDHLTKQLHLPYVRVQLAEMFLRQGDYASVIATNPETANRQFDSATEEDRLLEDYVYLTKLLAKNHDPKTGHFIYSGTMSRALHDIARRSQSSELESIEVSYLLYRASHF